MPSRPSPRSMQHLLYRCSTATVRSTLALGDTDPLTIRLVCTFPPEYCEFGNSLSKCKEWLQGQRPDLYEKYYSEGAQLHSENSHRHPSSIDFVSSQGALKAKLGTISREAQNKLEEDTAKKEAKAEAKADAARKKKLVRPRKLIERHLANHSVVPKSSQVGFVRSSSSAPTFLIHLRLS